MTGAAAGSDLPSVDAVQAAGEHVYWIEGRATGDVLVRSSRSGVWRRFCRLAWR
ncbi:MAG: hypothetical protein WCF33_12355 [Pseudonocardiaceae bacterium]